jgi:hypothetical protein
MSRLMASGYSIMKRSANLCIVLVIASSVIFAQTAKTPSTKTTVGPAVENRRSKLDEMREYKLRVFREHVLTRALDSIKKIDEAGLRVSARNRILTYLASEKVPSNDNQALATQIARDALTDLQKHNEEITPFMLNYLSNDLVSCLRNK